MLKAKKKNTRYKNFKKIKLRINKIEDTHWKKQRKKEKKKERRKKSLCPKPMKQLTPIRAVTLW
jgi:hypothetical protein